MTEAVTIKRKTRETDINLSLNLDGKREIEIETGIGFFDHMLGTLVFWAGWDLKLTCKGDLHVDTHHTIEDVALALGQAFRKSWSDLEEFERFGSAWAPLDEALSHAVVDLSGRPFCVFEADIRSERLGDYETTMTGHFFRSFATEARVTLHLRCAYGDNDHHKIESLFKALGLAIRRALAPRTGGLPSTKGAL